MMCSLKSALDRVQHRSRTGITHSSPLGVNKYLMERKFYAPCMEAIFFYMVWFGQRGKFVKEEATIKCEGEGDDDDARRRLGKPLIEQKWSCQACIVDQGCVNTFKSCMKDHGFATTRRYVRKSSSLIEPSSNIVPLL
jgi:hypothetical protein